MPSDLAIQIAREIAKWDGNFTTRDTEEVADLVEIELEREKLERKLEGYANAE